MSAASALVVAGIRRGISRAAEVRDEIGSPSPALRATSSHGTCRPPGEVRIKPSPSGRGLGEGELAPPDTCIEAKHMIHFASHLRNYAGRNVLNPYVDHDARFDLPNAAEIRIMNLRTYLTDHAYARVALIGEAAGYNGCRFTGIPFTCEAQLCEWNDDRSPTGGRDPPRSPGSRADATDRRPGIPARVPTGARVGRFPAALFNA